MNKKEIYLRKLIKEEVKKILKEDENIVDAEYEFGAKEKIVSAQKFFPNFKRHESTTFGNIKIDGKNVYQVSGKQTKDLLDGFMLGAYYGLINGKKFK